MRCQLAEYMDQVGQREAVNWVTQTKASQTWIGTDPVAIAFMKEKGISCAFDELNSDRDVP